MESTRKGRPSSGHMEVSMVVGKGRRSGALSYLSGGGCRPRAMERGKDHFPKKPSKVDYSKAKA